MSSVAYPWSNRDMDRLVRSGSKLGRKFLISLAVGIVAGLAARGLHTLLDFGSRNLIGNYAQPGSAEVLQFRWEILLLPMLGGLFSGVVVTYFCRPNRAHGTAILIDSFHHFGANLSLKDAVVRAIAAAGVIVLGGSVGKEAVIAVLAAAIGSSIANLFNTTKRERRRYLIAGCAAGVGAIFQCPLGGAIFAATVPYCEPEIEADALLPALVASVTSYSTYMAFGGYGGHLLSGTGQLAFKDPRELIAYGVLGLICAGASMLFYYCLMPVVKYMHSAKIPRWLAPSVAGLMVGVLACGLPQIMDMRYEFVQHVLDGQMLLPHSWWWWSMLLGLIVLAKCFATGLAIGTNTAGGLFGPVVFIGGVVGAATGAILEAIVPGQFPEHLRQAMIPVAMAGVLSASLRVPLAAIVMVTEMTGSYGLIVPLMLVSVISFLVGHRWGVYSEQLVSPTISPAHAGESLIALLESWNVKDVMDQKWAYIAKPSQTLAELMASIPDDTRPTFLVLQKNQPVGMISTEDIVGASRLKIHNRVVIAADLMSQPVARVYPEDDLYGTLELFFRHNVDLLPVVDHTTGEFLGMLSRAHILTSLRAHLSEQRTALLEEHSGFAVLEKEAHLAQLIATPFNTREEKLRRIPVPESAVGHSLQELNFRQRFGFHVIAIESSGVVDSPPNPVRHLQKDELLIVLAEKKD